MANSQYVQMLLESLEKKVAVLRKIQVLCLEQEQILNNKDAKPEEFEANIDAKQVCIDQLDVLDKGFQQIFDQVQPELEANKEDYREQILRMQELIRDITDRSVDVQAKEKTNYELATKKFSGIRTQARDVRRSGKAVSAYYQNMNKINGAGSQFMDSKK